MKGKTTPKPKKQLILWPVQGSSQVSWPVVGGLLQALVAALLMNVCIVGINQLYDVDIDRVNKPYLPLASGELSMQGGTLITCLTGLTCD